MNPSNSAQAQLAVAPPERILFINVTRIGDTLAGTPALHALHQHWPDAEITALGGAKRVEVLENLPGLHNVGRISKKTAPWRGWLVGRGYDLAIVNNYDRALVRYALRVARSVVAYRQGVAAIDRRLLCAVDPQQVTVDHFTDHVLNLLRPLGVASTDRRIRFQRSESEILAARQMLAGHGIAEAHPLIGLQIASFATKSYRDWPPESFLEITQRVLASTPTARFILFGGPDEAPRTQQLAEQIGPSALSLAGRLSLRQTGAIMGELDAYLGVDTGPTHLMSSFDIPVVALYHSRHPSSLYGPRDHPCSFVIDHPHAGDIDGEARSMAEIGVDTVWQQLSRALAYSENRAYPAK